MATNKLASKKKCEKHKAVEEYLPISCASEELSVILDQWIADDVIKLYKIDREPIRENKKHSCFCRYHRYVHHPIAECHYIRKLLISRRHSQSRPWHSRCTKKSFTLTWHRKADSCRGYTCWRQREGSHDVFYTYSSCH